MYTVAAHLSEQRLLLVYNYVSNESNALFLSILVDMVYVLDSDLQAAAGLQDRCVLPKPSLNRTITPGQLQCK